MEYTGTKFERESDSKGSFSSYSSTKQGIIIKRLLLLLIISIFLVFVGAQSAPVTKASSSCELVCGEPFIGSDRQCYQICCPPDDMCKSPCELRPCK
jgi:hypothetical protein